MGKEWGLEEKSEGMAGGSLAESASGRRAQQYQVLLRAPRYVLGVPLFLGTRRSLVISVKATLRVK